MKGKKVLPPTYLFFAIVSMTALHFLYPVMKIVHWPWSVLGLIPLACGVVINVVADNAFRKVKRPRRRCVLTVFMETPRIAQIS